MAVFLSPGVFSREVDLSVLPTASGVMRPAFIGAAKKGPLNTPTLITSATQYIDTFGEPFAESYLGYAVLACLEENGECYVVRVGVEIEDGQDSALADVAIDTGGTKIEGWGRIPLYSGIDYGRISLREIDSDNPAVFHPAAVSTVSYNDADSSDTFGATGATLAISGTYTGDVDDAYTVLITGDPDLSSNAKVDGATYQVIRSSDGDIVAEGTLHEYVQNQSQPISIGLGLTIVVRVTSGVLATNDTFTFTTQPDNRKFKVAVEGVNGTEYTMPTASYSANATLIAAINLLLSGQDYLAVTQTLDDGTVVPQLRTNTAGRWIQLATTSAWAKELGVEQYSYDIPRSYLLAVNESPYTIATASNKLVMKVIGELETVDFSFTIATGTNITATQLAAAIDPSGIKAGEAYFDAISLTAPGGDTHLLLITTIGHDRDQLQLMANYTNLKSLRFAEEVGIAFPYKRGYRGFFDSRVELPASSETDAATPASCDDAPLGASCSQDTAYFTNIVGYLVAPSAGTWLDDYTATLEIYTEGIGDVTGRYKLTIRDNASTVVESLEDISFDKLADRYIGNVVNPGSKYGGVSGNAYVNWEARPDFLAFDTTLADYDVRQPATFNGREFTGMANGIPVDAAYSSDLDAAVIGSPTLNTGLYSIQNPDTYDINLLSIPGFSSGSVISQAIQMCESRGDVLFLVDPPFGLRPQQVVDWHNGMLTSDLASAINSSYAALYWSWIKIQDQFSNETIWVPPSGHVSAVFARTSRVAETWSAPAGTARGRLNTALEVEYNPSRGEQNLLQGSGNAVNAILSFPQDGIVVFGQRTLQRQATALDRVGVRMLMIFLKKNLTRLVKPFIFEPNDEILWAQVKNTLDPFMADVQARRGMTGFKVVVDETNNTNDRRDRSELWISIFVKPTRAVEFVVLNTVVLRTGASFASQEVLAAGGIIGS